jgi:anti-sigma regulatory factor (Ser/Thr protein kinase)
MQTLFSVDLPNLEEDVVWTSSVKPLLSELPDNVQSVCYYGCAEILNNAIDHSEGLTAQISCIQTEATITLCIHDDGIGVFEKIRRHCSMNDLLQPVLEIVKGKLTTDPERHSGEGLFFSSRMFDRFVILANGIRFEQNQGNWTVEPGVETAIGTQVEMTLSRDSSRQIADVFSEYVSEQDGYSFGKTQIPVLILRYTSDLLISRSQAKRLMARLEQFESVTLDFAQVSEIGQGFADEAFRVWVNAHPETTIVIINANPAVQRMIRRTGFDRVKP